ncbi:GMC family oxidoreductase [Phototrophicus methaneseepsis]|uniref:GMC family oxidoreductase n=1 Tax=Phototrophicus methaneseepsis TaxID=2710758 RepID=A0A7S8E7G5_9CHLR|nr:GMC family oxidoreductase [Phototrophicus methaneseepsis]QPC81737.1 GMC family oxidoreductase [Phototrophicus methaneseepsis]
MATQKHVDVVTVGAGWTAGILAQQFTAANMDVISIEAGPQRWATEDFEHNHDSLRYTLRKAMMFDLNRETWTWRPNPNKPSLPIRQFGSFHPGQGIGGAGIHWAAQTWRFYPSDFNYRTHHIERYGEEKLPEGNMIQDWPLDYADLEPYYTQSEYDIGISGQVGNLGGTIIEGGNPFEGPHQRPYPLPPLVRSKAADMFSAASREMGYHPFPQPAAILSEAYRDISGRERSGCIYCGFCTRFGCEVDAKASANASHIPLALETGRYHIRTNCKVIRVESNKDGLATGVTYIDQTTGEEHFQPADIVILSAYTLSNVRLLLLSSSDSHPNGLGNDQDRVGKNYTYQLIGGPVTGLFKGQRFNSYMGNSCLQDLIHDFNADNFDHSDLDFIGGASISCGGGEKEPVTSTLNMPVFDMEKDGSAGDEDGDGNQGTRPRPPIASEVGSLAGAGTQWGQAWKDNLRENWDSVTGIGIQGESLPYTDQFLDLDPTYTDNMGQPLLRLTYDFHDNDYKLYRYIAQRCKEIMDVMNPDHVVTTTELSPYNVHSYQSTHCTGGAIMGDSPENSVTNRYGQVWDTPNLFVTGAALYPQNPGMNPTGTLLALAYWQADAIKNQYLREPNHLITY